MSISVEDRDRLKEYLLWEDPPIEWPFDDPTVYLFMNNEHDDDEPDRIYESFIYW